MAQLETSIAYQNICKLPYEQREAIFNNISETIEKASPTGLDSKLRRIEKNLTRFIIRTWRTFANPAVEDAIRVLGKGDQNKIVTKRTANQVLKALSKPFEPKIEKKFAKRYRQDIELYYDTNTIRFKTKFKKDLKKSKRKKIRKADIDAGITDQVTKLAAISIGDHFPQTLKPKAAKAINETIKKGLNKKNAALFLRDELTKIMGSTVLAVPRSISVTSEVRLNAYMRGLVETSTNMAQNFNHVTIMEEAGVNKYEIVAIIDKRTSDICNSLNGRIFDLKQGLAHRNKVLSLKNTQELKDFAGWRRDLDEFNLSAGEKLNDPGASEVLAKNGMSMPPYHGGRCRTEVHPA